MSIMLDLGDDVKKVIQDTIALAQEISDDQKVVVNFVCSAIEALVQRNVVFGLEQQDPKRLNEYNIATTTKLNEMGVLTHELMLRCILRFANSGNPMQQPLINYGYRSGYGGPSLPPR